MKRVPVNCPVVLFLMAVMYFASTANTSFWISARSTPIFLWKNHRFLLYWRFSSYWTCGVAAIGVLSFTRQT